jgi:hypothetical protein|tara:strand:+ start:1067 stop:1474 length:408 start_codon:yes stop_codon:yes gene_type:complete
MNKVRHLTFCILGEPASKSNSRRLVSIRGKPAFIKSKKAIEYLKLFNQQCPNPDEKFTEDVRVDIIIYYASRRPDLDESVILDAMQGKVYQNDRQVKQKRIYWGLDKDNPRAIINVSPVNEDDFPDYLEKSLTAD